jgi:ADP-ribose pyrophosphatase YjhB (NUDIX family)
VERGETPLEAAHREVFEELGFKVTAMVHLGTYRTDANRGFGMYHAFVALHGRPVQGHLRTGDLESATVTKCGLSDLVRMLATNAFKEVKWSNTASLAVNYVQTSRDSVAEQFRKATGA